MANRGCGVTDESLVLASSIRHPYTEWILHGEKTIEYRSGPTKIIGQWFSIDACKGSGLVAGVARPGGTCQIRIENRSKTGFQVGDWRTQRMSNDSIRICFRRTPSSFSCAWIERVIASGPQSIQT